MPRKWLGTSILLAAVALAAPLAVPVSAAASAVTTGASVSPQVVRSGAWSRLTPAKTPTTLDVGLARGTDGVLHVLWITGYAPKIRIMDTPIGQLGVVRPAVTIVSGWSLADFPGAAAASNGLDAFWVGTKPGDISAGGLFEVTRPLSGGKWSATKVAVSSSDGADFGVRDYSAVGRAARAYRPGAEGLPEPGGGPPGRPRADQHEQDKPGRLLVAHRYALSHPVPLAGSLRRHGLGPARRGSDRPSAVSFGRREWRVPC